MPTDLLAPAPAAPVDLLANKPKDLLAAKPAPIMPADKSKEVLNLFDPPSTLKPAISNDKPKDLLAPAQPRKAPTAKDKPWWISPVSAFNDVKDYVKRGVETGVKTAINPEKSKLPDNQADELAASMFDTPVPAGSGNRLMTDVKRPLGVAEAVTAPAGAMFHAGVSKPIERATGLKAEYTDLAQMFTPAGVAGAAGAIGRVKKAIGETEKIVGPAIRSGKRLLEGVDHEAIRAAHPSVKGKEGFITSTGRFVQRDEAAKIATQAKQLTKGTTTTLLHTSELKPDSAFQKGLKNIEKIFSPTTVSKSAKQTEGIVREARGTAEQRTAQASHEINSVAKEVNTASPQDQRNFVNYVETRSKGTKLKNPKLQKAADTVRDVYQRVRKQLEQSPHTDKMGFIQDYFVHQWKNHAKAQAFAAQWIAKAGNAKNTLKRSLPTIEDGLKAGLEPVHENPLDATLHYVGNMQNYLATKEINAAMKAQGMRKFFPKGKQPAGWVELKGPGNQVLYTAADAKKQKGAYAGINQAYAPEDAARVYNRYFGPGWTGPMGDVYRMGRALVNAPTQLLLGLSGYHYRLISNEATASAFAEGLGRAARGDIKGAAKSVAKGTPGIGGALAVRQGRRIEKAYLDPNSKDPVVRILTKAGARLTGLDRSMKASSADTLWESWRKGTTKAELAAGIKHIKDSDGPAQGAARTFGFAARNIGKLMDSAAYPLFAKTIPWIKNSVNYDGVADWMKAHPNASESEIVAAARDIVDSTDNRFGEMIQDNLFWDKKFKQTVQLMVLSVGWDLGTAREIIGGTKDLSKWISGSGELTPRAKYVIGAPIAHMLNASVYQYLKTGQGPQVPQDLVYPRTGGQTEESPGTPYAKAVPERLRLPSQMNDVLKAQRDPVAYLEDKMAPLWKIVGSMATNSDWRGDPISYQFEQNAPQGLQAYAGYLLDRTTPISVMNATKGQKTKSAIGPVEGIMGSNPAGMRDRDPAGFRKMMDAKEKEREQKAMKYKARQEGTTK
jgi:hypothetical protein